MLTLLNASTFKKLLNSLRWKLKASLKVALVSLTITCNTIYYYLGLVSINAYFVIVTKGYISTRKQIKTDYVLLLLCVLYDHRFLVWSHVVKLGRVTVEHWAQDTMLKIQTLVRHQLGYEHFHNAGTILHVKGIRIYDRPAYKALWSSQTDVIL